MSGGTQRRPFASKPERRNENINVNKYFTFSSGARTHRYPYDPTTGHDWPQLSTVGS